MKPIVRSFIKPLSGFSVIVVGAAVTGLIAPVAGGRAHSLVSTAAANEPPVEGGLDADLAAKLKEVAFTGGIQFTLEQRLGRPLNPELVNLGRLLWFDTIHSLGNDNTCAGCHSPTNGFGDTQSIAIGVENNGLVGPHRAGPRNQRRTPQMVNTGFYPNLMWNSRFATQSHNSFDLSEGARVPFNVGGTTVWVPGAPGIKGTIFDPQITKTLLAVQGNFPPTELIEVAGFAVVDTQNVVAPSPPIEAEGSFACACSVTTYQVDPRVYSPTHLKVYERIDSDTVPAPIAGPNGSPPDSTDRSYAIRAKVLDRLNAIPEYVSRFSSVFPAAAGGNITFAEFAAAVAEFEFSNTFLNAPIDRFARGEHGALTIREKKGALLFFGKASCVACHAVSGESNELFSDFQSHVAGIPQIAPTGFGLRPGGNPQNPADFPGDNLFDGVNTDEDFGREEFTNDPFDRYAFRTSPIRNVAVQPAFFHNGAYTNLRSALQFHLNTEALLPHYSAAAEGVAEDLTHRQGPSEPVLKRLDPRIKALGKLNLSADEFEWLYEFVANGLLDPGALPQNLCKLVPPSLPSGRRPLTFEACP
jgi:cytochrome c peroxidase